MPKQSLSKSEIQEKIKETFEGKPTEKEIKKIKKLAMSKNILLKNYKKLFCKKCFALFDFNSSYRIKKGFKIIKCAKCSYITRRKMNL